MLSEDEQFREHLLLGEGLKGKDEHFKARHSGHHYKISKYFWGLQLILFLASLSLLLSSIHIRNHSKICNDEDYTPMYSPALKTMRDTGYFHRFDGSFETPNPYKGPPSPSIDEHWNIITYATGGVISISEETLRAVNASAEYSVKLAPEMGGGYMASVEALHQLHCLNMLRQATYEEYYKDKAEPWKDSPQILRFHLDHCIDNLRQKLMCDADAGILTYVWAKGHPAPFPDFSVQHKCQDFGTLKNWVTEHQLFTDHRIERLEGAHELESPP